MYIFQSSLTWLNSMRARTCFVYCIVSTEYKAWYLTLRNSLDIYCIFIGWMAGLKLRLDWFHRLVRPSLQPRTMEPDGGQTISVLELASWLVWTKGQKFQSSHSSDSRGSIRLGNNRARWKGRSQKSSPKCTMHWPSSYLLKFRYDLTCALEPGCLGTNPTPPLRGMTLGKVQ